MVTKKLVGLYHSIELPEAQASFWNQCEWNTEETTAWSADALGVPTEGVSLSRAEALQRFIAPYFQNIDMAVG